MTSTVGGRFMRTMKVPGLVIVATITGAYCSTFVTLGGIMKLNKKLFPKVESGDRDKNYFLYHPMSVEESREKAKELIVAELIKSAQATQEYYNILDQLEEQAEESVREHGVSLTDDAYTAKLEEWINILKAEEAQVSKSEQNFLRSWLNRQNSGIAPVREALDDCYVEASKNQNALKLNFLAPPSRTDIAKIAAQFAEEA